MVQSPRGGSSDPSGDSPLFAYVICPRCRRQIREPFSRTSGPVPYVHSRPNRSACRLIVSPASSGTAHSVTIVPDNVRLEEALRLALQAT